VHLSSSISPPRSDNKHSPRVKRLFSSREVTLLVIYISSISED
jgi:hypothetical protein